MSDIIFHSLTESSYLWTAMHVADEKGVSFELRTIELNSPEHLKLHPFGKMPVLQHGDRVVYESIAIAHYIDRTFSGPALQPDDPYGHAQVLRWLSIVNSYVFPTMNRIMKERLVKAPWGFEVDEAFIAAALPSVAVQMRLIEEATSAHKFLIGDSVTLADSFLLPLLVFFSLAPEGKAFLAKAPSAQAWLDRMTARPSFQRSPMRKSSLFEITTTPRPPG